MSNIESALREWYTARMQFFGAVVDSKGMVPRPFWDRLGAAEYALMQIARALPVKD